MYDRPPSCDRQRRPSRHQPRSGHVRLIPPTNAPRRQNRQRCLSEATAHRGALRPLLLHDLWYSSIPHNHSNRPTGDALSAPESTQTFSTATLHRHRRTCSLGKAQLHLVAPRRQLRRFGDDRAIDISNAPPVCPHEGGDMAKHGQGVCPLPLRIGVRKVLPDIAETSGAEQRISDRVGRSVGVAMPVQPNHTFKDTATENHRA
jgi:hypothetical protein